MSPIRGSYLQAFMRAFKISLKDKFHGILDGMCDVAAVLAHS